MGTLKTEWAITSAKSSADLGFFILRHIPCKAICVKEDKTLSCTECNKKAPPEIVTQLQLVDSWWSLE